MLKRCGLCVLIISILIFGLAEYTMAGSATAAHVVTTKVEPVAILSLTETIGVNWTRLIVDVTGINTKKQNLEWTTNLEGMRVTVHSNLATDEMNYILRVRAVSLDSKGRSTGWVVVDNKPSALITGIAREVGGCSVEYEASPKTDRETDRDDHIITFTITE